MPEASIDRRFSANGSLYQAQYNYDIEANFLPKFSQQTRVTIKAPAISDFEWLIELYDDNGAVISQHEAVGQTFSLHAVCYDTATKQSNLVYSMLDGSALQLEYLYALRVEAYEDSIVFKEHLIQQIDSFDSMDALDFISCEKNQMMLNGNEAVSQCECPIQEILDEEDQLEQLWIALAVHEFEPLAFYLDGYIQEEILSNGSSYHEYSEKLNKNKLLPRRTISDKELHALLKASLKHKAMTQEIFFSKSYELMQLIYNLPISSTVSYEAMAVLLYRQREENADWQILDFRRGSSRGFYPPLIKGFISDESLSIYLCVDCWQSQQRWAYTINLKILEIASQKKAKPIEID